MSEESTDVLLVRLQALEEENAKLRRVAEAATKYLGWNQSPLSMLHRKALRELQDFLADLDAKEKP